jgi:hypothetical protein
MADRLKDNEDLVLEALFRAEPIADDGFSKQVVGTLKRRIWTRRIMLPAAVFVGSAIAAKPVSVLLGSLGDLLNSVPGAATALPLDSLPSAYTLVAGGMLLAVALFGLNMLEE